MNIKNLLLALLSLLVWIMIVGQIYHFDNDNQDTNSKKSFIGLLPAQKVKNDFYREFEAYLDYKITIFKNRKELSFEDNITDSIMSYLSTHPNQKISITALFTSSERRDIAKGRSNYFRKKLVEKGVDPYLIYQEIAEYDYQYNLNNSFPRGVLLRYDIIDADELSSVKKKIVIPQTKMVYNKFYGMHVAIKKKITDPYIKILKTYLVNYPEKRIKIVGYTDNKNTKEYDNLWIGRKRAEEVQWYYLRKGINSKRITTISKGSANPIASNNTRKGRLANRRVEVVIY